MDEVPPLRDYHCRCSPAVSPEFWTVRVTTGRVAVAPGWPRDVTRDALRKYALDLAGPPAPGLRRDAVRLTWDVAGAALSFYVVDREAPQP